MNISPTSQTISVLRLPLAIMVVFIHSFGSPREYPIDWSCLDGEGVYNIIRIFGSHVFSHIAVPTFFLISGYLFFVKMESSDWAFYKKQWSKRLRTLLVPYLIWNLFAALFWLPFKVGAVLFKGKPWSCVTEYVSDNVSLDIFWGLNSWGGCVTTLLNQVTEPNFGPASFPLWFLRDLMVAVVVAPILCWLLRKTRGYLLLLLGVLYVFKVQFFIHSMMVNALLFFSIGSWFALCKRGFAEFAVKHFAWTLPVWMLLLAVEVYYDGANTDIGLAIYPWMILVGVFAFIGAVAKWRNLSQPVQNKYLRYAADNTFFIYVTHVIFGLFLAWIVLDRLPLLPVVRYLVAPFMAIAICLVVLWLMRFFFPTVAKVVNGER